MKWLQEYQIKKLHSAPLKVCFYLRVYLISRWPPPITSGANNLTHHPSSSSVFFVFPSWKRITHLFFTPVTHSNHKQGCPSWRHQLNEKSMSSLFQTNMLHISCLFFSHHCQLILFVRMIQSQVVLLLPDCLVCFGHTLLTHQHLIYLGLQ